MPQEEVEKLSAAVGTDSPSQEEPRGGITPASVLTGAALLLALAWFLPTWSLTKSYMLGMGTLVPLEALVLTLVLLLFNRFGAKLLMVGGVVAAALLTPHWHAAVYTKSAAAAKMLSPFGEWLYTTCAGMITPAQQSEWTPTFLVAAGALLAFAAGALPAWLMSVALPALRRKLVWRELIVVFVLISCGIYACYSVQFIVGALTSPYKDDDATRNFKRFYRPVPIEQDPDNAGGIPSKLVPYDPSNFDLSKADEQIKAAADEEKAALERFRKGIRKALPEPERVEQLLADSDAVAAWLKGAGRGSEITGRLLGALDKARGSLLQAKDAKATADALKAMETAVDEIQSEKNAIDNAAGREPKLFRKDVTKALAESERVKQLLAEGDDAGAWLRDAGRGPEITARLLGALDKGRYALLQARDVKAAADALKAFETAVDEVQSKKTAIDKAAGREPEPVKADAAGGKYRGQGRALAQKIRAGEKGTFLSRWAKPLCWWMALLGLVLLVQVFLAVMLRRQWTDHEKLMFPHAEVVRALAEGADLSDQSRRIFASPLFWIGTGLSAVIFLFQGLNHYFPSVPAPNLQAISLNTFISERPWTAMDRTLSLQPYLLAISYLLTSEVSLSMWLFAVVNQALRVAASAWGIPRDEAWAIHGEWANSDALYTGAILIFVGWLAWSGRRHIWYVFRRGLGLIPSDASERGEPMGYPTAFWGFWLCLAGIMAWCLLAGLKLWIMAVFFGLYLVLVALISRLVAEAGLITAAAGFWPYYPQFTFAWIFGFGQGAAGKMIAYKDSWLGAGGTLIPTTLRAASVWSFIWPSMLHIMPLTPVLLTGFKLTESEPRRKRLLTWLMIAAVLAGVAIFLAVTLDTAFDRGAQGVNFYCGKNTPNWVFANWLMRDLVNKERMWTYDLYRIGAMAVGALVMGGLLIFRSLFYWWPLHPIGMVAIGIDGVWFCFLLGWLLKRAALAYGGGAFSQRINTFFFGLIVGQFGMAAFWSLLGLCGTGVMPPLLPDMG
jgi:hypothetical protein